MSWRGQKGETPKGGRKEKHYLPSYLPLTPLFHNNQGIQGFRVEEDDGWWVEGGQGGETPKGGRKEKHCLPSSYLPLTTPIVS